MGDHRQKRIEEIAAEITGPIVEAIITAGPSGSDGRLSDTPKAKAIGEAAESYMRWSLLEFLPV